MQPHPLLAKVKIIPCGLKKFKRSNEEFIEKYVIKGHNMLWLQILQIHVAGMDINVMETPVDYSMYSLVRLMYSPQASISYRLSSFSLYKCPFCWVSLVFL